MIVTQKSTQGNEIIEESTKSLQITDKGPQNTDAVALAVFDERGCGGTQVMILTPNGPLSLFYHDGKLKAGFPGGQSVDIAVVTPP